jgi:putative phosphoesterase
VRIAIVSDVHGHVVALEAVIAALEGDAPDVVFHGGDIAAIGPRPAEVIDRIRDLGWSGVMGNTDEILFDTGSEIEAEQLRRAPNLRGWLRTLFGTLAPWAAERLNDEQITWLRKLPRELRHDGLLLVHASPTDLWRAPMPTAADEELVEIYGGQSSEVVAYGHIHRPFVRTIGGLTVANTGSVGLPYDGDWRPSYVLIDDGEPSVRRVSYDLDRSARDTVAAGFQLARWLAEVQRAGSFHQPGADEDPRALA